MLRRWLLVALALISLLAFAGEIGTSPPSVQAAPDQVFAQTCPAGGEQSFVVPAGATQMRVTLNAARGVDGFASTGGAGATVIGTFSVTAGTQYFLDLGCTGNLAAGGWNAGGSAGTGTTNEAGGGGGGASVLRTTACGTLPNPCPDVAAGALLVAGSGGGGAGNGGQALGGNGGGHVAASADGQNGSNGTAGGNGGGGATPAAPGTATISNGSSAGDPGGVAGKGGSGSNSVSSSGAGGGGGGGCHGGGGGSSTSEGSGGGGGGGSSCAGAGASNVTYGVNPNVVASALVQFSSPPVLTKSFNPTTITSGGVSTMTITLDNANPRPITDVSFTDNLAAAGIQVAAVPNFTQNCGIGTFTGFTAASTLITVSGVGLSDDGLPGQSCTITVDVTATTLGLHTNSIAQVSSAENGAGPGASAGLTVIAPDLTIAKTHASVFIQGQTGATFTITVTNTGNASTSGAVTVTDTLPVGLTATAFAGTGWTCTLAPLSCTRADALASTASYPPITLTVNVAGNAPANMSNVAVVSGGNEPAFATGNNTATDPVTVGSNAADLALTKTGGTGTFPPGTVIPYTLTLTNNGPAIATSVVLSDPIPANTTFVAAASGDPAFSVTAPAVGAGPPAVVTFNGPALNVNGSVTFTISVRINLNAPPGPLVNTAIATSANADPVSANNTAATNGIVSPAATTPTPTPTPTATPSPFVPPVIPQVFQNPGAPGIFAPGNRNTPVPRVPGVVLSSNNAPPPAFRPPNTGDAGLKLTLPKAW